MTDSESDLPTVAIFTFDTDYSQGIKWNNNPPYLDFEEGDELVRRSDVLELIDQRKKRLQNTETETKGQHNVRAAKLQELKELRQEVEQE